MSKSVSREELASFLNDILNVKEYSDYCPNGLQIEGSNEVKKVAFAVSAQRSSIESACAWKADAMIVHHGVFWKFHGAKTITGPFSKRIIPLIKNDINLFGYHLPLDAHIKYGNAKGLADAIGLTELMPFGDYKGMPTGVWGKLNSSLSPKELKDKLKSALNHDVISSDAENDKINSIGIITGGANSNWVDSLKLGLDAYITGEMSEHDYHESREAGIHMFAGGHNATERFGVLSLKSLIEEKFGLECLFIDSENPA